MKINNRLAGTIKLPFRKLNSVLCEQVWRDPHVGVKEIAISMNFRERSDKKVFN